MKHLFYIHSHITYLVALEVVKYEGLIRENCVFMYGRNFRPEGTYAPVIEIQLPYTHHPQNSFAVKRIFWKGWSRLKQFDSFVEQLTEGQDYLLYTNQTGIDFIRLFVSHKHCKGFNFLEEGVASYHTLRHVNDVLCPAGSSSLFYKTLLFLNYNGRLTLHKWFYDPKYTFVYGVTEYAFPKFKRKILLPSPFINHSKLPGFEHILVLDATAEYGLVRNESIAAALAIGLEKLVETGVNELWVKYHPDQHLNSETIQFYRRIFDSYRHRIDIKELPQELCLELVAGNQGIKHVTFYVFLSSVGLYAGILGRKVYTLAPLVAKYEPKYYDVFHSLPKVYKDSVCVIDEIKK